MAYTAQDLITRSWYLSGIVARNLQVPTGDQITNGLQILNSLLDFKQIETDLVPFYQYISLPCVPNQEYYFLPYVAAIETATFDLGVVRYPMSGTTRTDYFGSSRVNNISTLPFSWHFERALGGGNLALYFLPDQNYLLKLMVKIYFTDVTLTTDLTNITDVVPYTFINNSNQGFDLGYIEYLRYELSYMMCGEYGVDFSPQNMKTLMGYRRKLMYESPPDISIKKHTILTASEVSGYNWGDVNIGHGYRP